MGRQNNTTVAVSRFKPVQCIACRFLTVTLCVVCRSSSWVSFGKSDFQEKHFKISFMQSLLFNWFLKVLSVPKFLYIQCDKFTKLVAYLGCCGHRLAVKKKKKKKKHVFILFACLYIILTVSVSPTPLAMYIQTKTNVSQTLFSVSHSENTARHNASERCTSEVLFTFFAVNTKRSIAKYMIQPHTRLRVCVWYNITAP